MKTLIHSLLTLCLLSPAFAQDGVTMTYQGQLADAAGAPVSASHPMTFRLYNVVAGGEALWTELHGSVEVVDGSFTADLGSITDLAASLSDEPALFLGVQVGDNDEMAPRIKVGGALKAQWAKVADHARDVRGEDIHPASVSIGERAVIDADGRWVGDPTGLQALPVSVAPKDLRATRAQPGPRVSRALRALWAPPVSAAPRARAVCRARPGPKVRWAPRATWVPRAPSVPRVT